MDSLKVNINYSPDADDLFMMYALLEGRIAHPKFELAFERNDIEVLNKNARLGKLEVTALSVHAYAYVSNTYAILNSGASFAGRDFGPRLLATRPNVLTDESKYRLIAAPGEMTSAHLALQIYLKENDIETEIVNMPFDAIQEAVKNGDVDAGIVIHEGQLTYAREGLIPILDFGAWWWQKHHLPLPLGIMVIRKSFSDEDLRELSTLIKNSIQYGLDHREETLAYAIKDARGLKDEELDQYINMYVNNYTVDMGALGKESIEKFLSLGVSYGFIKEMPNLLYV